MEEFGSKQPMAVRNQVYGAMYEEILNAVNKGQPASRWIGGMSDDATHAHQQSMQLASDGSFNLAGAHASSRGKAAKAKGYSYHPAVMMLGRAGLLSGSVVEACRNGTCLRRQPDVDAGGPAPS